MKKLLSSLCFVLVSLSCFSQQYMGVATGNNSAINSIYLNPSSISGCNEKVVVNLFSVNVAADNNLGTFTQLSNVSNGSKSAFNISGTQDFSMLVPVMDVRLPSVMVSLNDKLKQSFAITTRVRAINQFNHFDPNLYSAITDPSRSSTGNYAFQSNNFNWTAHVWSEIGFSYALQVMDQGAHKISAGVTVKILGGIDYLSLTGKNLNVSYKAGSDSFFATKSDLEFASNAISSNSAVSNGVQSSDVLGSIFGSRAGSGLGFDAGLTYTYKEKEPVDLDDNTPVKNTHQFKASVAVRDLGAIKYTDANNFVVKVTGNGFLTGPGLSGSVKDWNDFRNYMVGQGFTADTGNKATKLYMPTTLVGGLDYQLHNRFYLNATVIANMAKRSNNGNSYYSMVTVTPRYDTRRLTVALPITYSMLANDMKLGFGFRFAGFFAGSDDMMALFSNNQHGFGVYFGGYVPIYKKKEKPHFGKEQQ